MKLVRTILALLVLLAVLLAQIAPAGEVSFATSNASCCCHQATCCCQSRTNSNNEPAPATAARTITQSDWQFVSTVVEPLVSNFTSAQQAPRPSEPIVALAAIPLYQRNCVLLI